MASLKSPAMKFGDALAEEMLIPLQEGFAEQSHFWQQHKYGPDTPFHSYLITDLVSDEQAQQGVVSCHWTSGISMRQGRHDSGFHSVKIRLMNLEKKSNFAGCRTRSKARCCKKPHTTS